MPEQRRRSAAGRRERWIRTLPEPSSQPLSTRSYAWERTFSRSSPSSPSSSAQSSTWGIVNGWWAGIGRPSPRRPSSNSGKSTTHRKCRPPSFTGGRPSSRRSSPSTWQPSVPLVGDEQAAGRRRSAPSAVDERRPARRRRGTWPPASSSVDGPSSPASTRIHTRPLAPQRLACVGQVVEPAAAGVAAPPGTTDALDAGRLEGVELGGREHVGQLDQLHAEAHVGLVGAEAVHGVVPGHARDLADRLAGHGLDGRDRPRRRWPRGRRPGSTKLISASSWVNSNWRSARRSSSRRQRAIW